MNRLGLAITRSNSLMSQPLTWKYCNVEFGTSESEWQITNKQQHIFSHHSFGAFHGTIWLPCFQVIDFGSSCYDNQRIYTYIQSRFYRAPEVIIGARYGMPIDMWSFGCILSELLTGYPLFGGEDEADQLACIIEICGMLPSHLLESAKRTRHFVSSQGHPWYCQVGFGPDGSVQLTGGRSRRGKYRGPPGTKDLASDALRNCEDRAFVDFLQRCLDLDPESRMTPVEAIRHPWLTVRRNSKQLQQQHGDTTTTATTTTHSGPSHLRRHPAATITNTTTTRRHRANKNHNNIVSHSKLAQIIGTM